MPNHYPNLNLEKALIWRIVHRDNLPWILVNGLYAGNGVVRSDQWINIGNEDLIGRRATRHVPIVPGMTLNDYVPFYFTPFSPMMYNIHTGRGGVSRRSNAEIVILVSSLRHVHSQGHQFVFTDRHAYPVTARFFNDLNQLTEIDWPLLQMRNFKRNPNDPEQIERYQAEALIYQHLPVSGLLGIVCYTDELKSQLEKQITQLGIKLDIHRMQGWYF
jgi:ssDNA thymidine ADP-ribosyltransferase, DarT